MKCSCDVKGACQSWGGIVVITALLIVVAFALFSSSGPGKKLAGNGAKVEWEDLQEQGRANHRNIVVKDGQKLVVF